MGRLKACLGYAWAALAVPLVLATFLGQEPLSRAFARGTGWTISPRYSGGGLARTVEHGGYRTHLRRPVFDGLLGERRRGFVQVEWEPVAALPDIIEEDVDAQGRGRFRVSLDTRTGKAVLRDASPEVLGLSVVTPFHGGWMVRVDLKKP
ncbi:MAG: hypothetical protein PHU21_02070 [Elusimicrobia bacterium]|nr:hypothetical protein [Elusimicrobiota bacterium]